MNGITRRGLLRSVAGGSVVVLAGCADPQAVLELDEVSDAELADRVALDSDDEVVRRTVENGSYTTEGDLSGLEAPMGERPVVHNGTYYYLSFESEVVSEERLYALRVENVGSSSVDGELSYDELPEGDREALSRVFDEEGTGEEGFEGGAEYPYAEDEYERSELVDGATVVYNGSRYEVEGEQLEVMERNEYTYTAEEVAEDADAFADWARDEYGFVLDGLSEEERGIVEDAIDGGYYEGSASDGFESLVNRFVEHEAVIRDEYRGEWVVEYEGTTYYAELYGPTALPEDDANP
jgi:hypothetical protein